MPSPKELADRIEVELRAAAQPARAEAERAYLKSDLEFLGVPVAAIRKAARRPRNAGHGDAVSLAEALWSVPIFERRLAAVEVLTASASGGLLVPEDIAVVERMLRESRTWALVDPLATHVAGALVAAHPELGATLDRWVEDENFWLRRAAVLALLVPLRRGGGEPDRFFRYADQLLDEREFFLRKAIGWVLRDMSRKRPQLVRDWVEPRIHRISGVTLREAVKYLDASDRDRLVAAQGVARAPRGKQVPPA